MNRYLKSLWRKVPQPVRYSLAGVLAMLVAFAIINILMLTGLLYQGSH